MTEIFQQYGLFGLFMAGFLSGSVFPFNSEAVLSLLILSGFDTVSCLIAVITGNVFGGASIFYLGYLGKVEWIEKYGKVKHEKLVAILPRLNKYGPLMASLSFVPLIGDVIILGLGFFRISPVLTLVFMTIGKILRYLLLIGFLDFFR
jgi:membrane protein YqaA with SNARE-associated domain